MLQLVLGRNYCDKTEYLRNLASEKVKSGNMGLIFIVPEQFSYDTEKGMLEKVGAAGMQNVEVLSLTRLAELVLEKTGKKSDKQPVDKGVKMLTMSMALEELSDRLSIFRKYASRPALTESIVSLATELKQCSVSVDELSDFAENTTQLSLKNKLEELSLIISTYNALLTNSYYDTDDQLTLLSRALADYGYFRGKSVYIDGFTRFTKQEMGVIEMIIAQSDEVYIAFNTDTGVDYHNYPQFENINAQVARIKRVAESYGVLTAEPVYVNEETVNGELMFAEKNIFNPQKQQFSAKPENVTVYAADNKADECDFVALSIKKLMREKGVRCRDIIVYQRDKGGYDSELVSAFRRYGVPFFEDRRQPVEAQPLMVFVGSLLELVCNGLTTESLMRYLKTGLTSLTDDEIDELENYAFMWNIKTSQWKNDFTDNPDGFGSELGKKQSEALAVLNEYRKKAVGPILKFKNDFTEAQGSEKAAVLFEFLKSNRIGEKLKELTIRLADGEYAALFDEQGAVWTALMGMLDRLYIAASHGDISNKRFYELFNLLLSVTDLGTLPSGLDGVTLALADRTRTGIKKYAFIIGANDGMFPKTPSSEGLLNDSDRDELKKAGIELAETAQYKNIEEQYIAYCALSSASDGLFISCSMSDYKGAELPESEIISEIKAAFPKLSELKNSDISPLERIESRDSAFSVLAHSYSAQNSFCASVEEYFKDNPVYSGRVATLRNAAEKREKRISDRAVAAELFGKNMYLSASRIETYSNCPFEYFCKYGLYAQARKKAVMDNALSGSVLHRVFEVVLSEIKTDRLVMMNETELKAEIDAVLKDYLDKEMGGEAGKTQRFLSSYRSLSDRLLVIFKRLCEEFRNCEFVPLAFEVNIGDNREDDIPSYKIELSDGSTLRIKGKIDRVDIMKSGGESFVRVVDYKSSGKEFSLGDVLNGTNMQMLIYLFALYENGKGELGDFVPGGVLYMPANTAKPELSRNADDASIAKKELHSNAMKGVVLDEEPVLRGMEKELKGWFIPAKMNSKGILTGSFISRKAFMRLKDVVDETMKTIAENMHDGIIKVLPREEGCKYCDYKSVCGFEEGDPVLEVPEIGDAEARNMLEAEEADTDE